MATPDARRTSLALAACLCAAYAYFYQAGGWNQNSRFALVRAMVEQRTFRIDDTVRFDGHLVTGDLAEHGGHDYSDKAPGLAFVAAVPVAIAHPFVAEPSSRRGIATLSYIATLFAAGLPTVLAALLVFRLALTLGGELDAAIFAAAVFGLATPAWCYATLLFGHALATACLAGAFAAAVALREVSTAKRDWLLASAIGASVGWASITEYPTAIPGAIVGVLALSYVIPDGRAHPGRSLRVVIGMLGGGVVCLVLLMLFDQAAFGAPLNLGYANIREFQGMTRGFFGLTRPSRVVLAELLFGRYRGLLPLTPVLAVTPIGFLLFFRAPSSRRPGIAAAAIVGYYFLFNASYFYWDGGWSYGPRHIAPALPFASLALAPVWSRARSLLRAGLGVLALCSLALTLVAVSTTAQPPDRYRDPMRELLWPNFASGRLSSNYQAFVEDNLQETRDPVAHAWNLGEKLGLQGRASLAPLFAIWGIVGFAWWRRR